MGCYHAQMYSLGKKALLIAPRQPCQQTVALLLTLGEGKSLMTTVHLVFSSQFLIEYYKQEPLTKS